jgi:hypothetical protein
MAPLPVSAVISTSPGRGEQRSERNKRATFAPTLRPMQEFSLVEGIFHELP